MSTPGTTCALCLRPSVLINSHIIPEFVYTALYDDLHRFHQLQISEGESSLHQKGHRQPLLCKDCEQRFSIHEKYVSEVFSGKIPVHATQVGKLIKVTGLDYFHFKLFGLSILWRAGVCSHRFFSKVELGPHQEVLRQMLLADSPGPRLKYAFLLSQLISAESDYKPDDIIVEPTLSRFNGHRCYRFVFSGMIWTFTVSSHNLIPPISSTTLSEEGEMQMILTRLEEVEFIMSAIRECWHAQWS